MVFYYDSYKFFDIEGSLTDFSSSKICEEDYYFYKSL